MPTYEYQCNKCLLNFEVFQKFSDKPLRKHPECGGKVEKVFHPRGVTFKGSGFYVNDSRSKNGEGADESSKGKPTKEKSSDTAESGSSSIAAEKAAVTSSDSKGD